MEKLSFIPGLLVLVFLVLLRVSAEEEKPLRLAQTIALPAVEGRIDHLAVDVQSQRLFLAALGNNTLEVIDLKAGKVIHSVKGLREPQGVAFVPEANAVYVANGGDGNCEAFAIDSLAPLRNAKFSGDADNLRYDPGAKLIYAGYGDGAIGIFEALTGKIVGDIKLPAHPEAFALEQSGARIFVNIPNAKQVAVIDRKKGAVIAQWPVTQATANYPMALDESHHRLFIGCRRPARILALDTGSGKMVSFTGGKAMKRTIIFLTVWIATLVFALSVHGQTQFAGKQTEEAPVIIFVCEHGAAKSILSAAIFNKLAVERSLNLRAIARGTNPDPEISPKVAAGLRAG